MQSQRILCPVDFSDCSGEALRAAADLAKQSGGALTLLHVYSAASFADAGPAFTEALDQLKASAERALAGWRRDAELRGAQKVDTYAILGVPWEEIVALARSRESDLIVVGTHGRTGLKHALVGSVAEKVVRHAPCSVLVVRAARA